MTASADHAVVVKPTSSASDINQMNLFLSRLDEDQRRWYLALESQRMGWGADRLLTEVTGVDEKSIRPGREELAASLVNRPVDRVRRPGAGRPSVEKKRR